MPELRMLERLDRRVTRFLDKVEKLKRKIKDGTLGGEEDRLWLDQFSKGVGVDICCGDFTVEGAIGVDFSYEMIGADYSFISGDELTTFHPEECDFVVTNYLDAFPNVLKTLNEWHRVLKPGGVLALVCSNVDAPEYAKHSAGPLHNKSRVSLFTSKSLEYYLARANFEDIKIEPFKQRLRASARKPLR